MDNSTTFLRERWINLPNTITWIRILACVVVFMFAAHLQSETLNFIGLALYWLLDVVDGGVARFMRQETRLGAQLDILGDRLLTACFYFNYIQFHPYVMIPAMWFLLIFMVLDHFLSNQFMRWKLLSPNYFYRVDRIVWQLNWSPAGKVLNSTLVTIILVFTDWVVFACVVCAAITVIKIYCMVRLQRIDAPETAYPELKES